MIINVTLRSWKAFETLDLPLPSGTSFIVARNGVGKTSLLQAIHFGLFGERRLLSSGSSVERAVRGGANQAATVVLTVDLRGRNWVVERRVPGSLTARDPLPAATVEVDGTASNVAEWEAALSEAAGVGLTELRLLSAIGEGSTLSPPELEGTDRFNLVQHLSQVLGVSRLREAAAALRRVSKDASSTADSERISLRVRPQRAAKGELQSLTDERAELQVRASDFAERLDVFKNLASHIKEWRDWRYGEEVARSSAIAASEAMREVLEAQSRRLAEVAPEALREADFERKGRQASESEVDVAAALKQTSSRLIVQLQDLRDRTLSEMGGYDARSNYIDSALELLAGDVAICPTCRRPLSAEAASKAWQTHLQERSEVEGQRTASAQRLQFLVTAIDALATASSREIPPPTAPPQEPEPSEDAHEVSDAIQSLERQLEQVTSRLHEIAAAERQLDVNAKLRSADTELARRLVVKYRKADLGIVTADAFSELADAICRERINPLADVLGKRWAELWPGRPQLHLDPGTGDIYGTLADAPIGLADLSGGERAVAIVLLRLLALQSASQSPILLMDEPLEHLDPRNRRMLASLLVAATANGDAAPPRQILVTTYEESVTRRLDARITREGNSHVVYVASLPDGAPD